MNWKFVSADILANYEGFLGRIIFCMVSLDITFRSENSK